MRNLHTRWMAGGAFLLCAVGAGLWLRTPNAEHRTPPPGLVYTPEGFGGFVAPKSAVSSQPSAISPASKASDPLQPARAAYDAGRYEEAEAAALQVVKESRLTTHDSPLTTPRARLLLAFAAARRQDYPLARARFEVARQEAAQIANRQSSIVNPTVPGEREASVEEEAAYQHAVLTAKLGDGKAAEQEYLAFMRRYPESPLVHAAVRRIARMHGGDFPKEAEAAWKQAMETLRRRQRAWERERAMCGPRCLAELLRRRGDRADFHAMAQEMGTTHEGTSLKAMAEAAKKRGFAPRGFLLTPKGLTQQKMPALALIAPDHYVVVEAVTPREVRVWDPLGEGKGKAETRRYTPKDWNQVWKGVTLTLF